LYLFIVSFLDSYPIITENDNGLLKANIPYYYEATLNELSNLNNANRAKRLAQETVTLSNSLPLSYSSSVFVRCDEERLDVMKVGIYFKILRILFLYVLLKESQIQKGINNGSPRHSLRQWLF